MQSKEAKKPAIISGMMWFTFSGTAMLSAFILPVHFWALSHGMKLNFPTLIIQLYFFVLIFASLYHGLYRVKTIAADLGLARFEHFIGLLCLLLGGAGTITAAYLLFI